MENIGRGERKRDTYLPATSCARNTGLLMLRRRCDGAVCVEGKVFFVIRSSHSMKWFVPLLGRPRGGKGSYAFGAYHYRTGGR